MKKFSLVSALFLTACVTINIYFPAAAAEQVADEIIKGIQAEEIEKLEEEGALSPQSKIETFDSISSASYHLLSSAFDLLIPSAQAAGVDFSVNTAEIRQLRAAMKARYAALKPFYAKGLVGIKSGGFLVNRGSIPLKDRNKVKKLLAAENADRQKLYQEIANANNHPEWFAQIKSTFATRWINHAKPGWWYQSSNGNWTQK